MKNDEIRRLQDELEVSRQQIEGAFRELEDKIRFSSEKLQDLGTRAVDLLRSMDDFMRENSIPVAAICLIGGYMIGARISRTDMVKKGFLRPIDGQDRQPARPEFRGRPGTFDELKS